MEINMTAIEDMRDDARCMAEGVLELLVVAQVAAGEGVQLGREGFGVLCQAQEEVIASIRGITLGAK